MANVIVVLGTIQHLMIMNGLKIAYEQWAHFIDTIMITTLQKTTTFMQKSEVKRCCEERVCRRVRVTEEEILVAMRISLFLVCMYVRCVAVLQI